MAVAKQSRLQLLCCCVTLIILPAGPDSMLLCLRLCEAHNQSCSLACNPYASAYALMIASWLRREINDKVCCSVVLESKQGELASIKESASRAQDRETSAQADAERIAQALQTCMTKAESCGEAQKAKERSAEVKAPHTLAFKKLYLWLFAKHGTGDCA